MNDLFKGSDYPCKAGWIDPTTSKGAADAIEDSGKAPKLREEVLRVLAVCLRMSQKWSGCTSYEKVGMTADELAAEMGESVFSVRPRVAELHKQGLIERTGERRPSSNGRASAVWRLVS